MFGLITVSIEAKIFPICVKKISEFNCINLIILLIKYIFHFIYQFSGTKIVMQMFVPTYYSPMLLPSIFSICIGLSLLLSTPLLGVGEGHRGDGGSLSMTTTLSKDLVRRLGNIFDIVVVLPVVDNNLAISCSIDRGSTVARK